MSTTIDSGSPSVVTPPAPRPPTVNNSPVGSSAAPGVTLRISTAGQQLAATTSARNQSKNEDRDIDESNLPDSIKAMLKSVRWLERELARLQKEVHSTMASNLPPEQKRAKIDALNAAIRTASAMMNDVLGHLRVTEMETTAKMSPQQKQEFRQTVTNLLAKPVKCSTDNNRY